MAQDLVITTPKGFTCNVTRTNAWMDAEMNEYMTVSQGSRWKQKKEKDGVVVYKRDQKHLGESTDVPCYNMRAKMHSTLERLHEFMHVKFIENSAKWDKTFAYGHIVERPAKELFGNPPMCEEVVVNYVAHKLPIIDNRDYLFYSFKRFFTAPNPMTPGKTAPTRGIAFFTCSTPPHPEFPDPMKGYVRAVLNKVICIIQEIDGEPGYISYYYVQQSDIRGMIPKNIQQPQTIDHMIKQFGLLLDNIKL